MYFRLRHLLLRNFPPRIRVDPIWLERLLDQERSTEVGLFLGQMPTEQLLVTDFTLHSIGVILDRLDRQAVLLEFVDRDILKE